VYPVAPVTGGTEKTTPPELSQTPEGPLIVPAASGRGQVKQCTCSHIPAMALYDSKHREEVLKIIRASAGETMASRSAVVMRGISTPPKVDRTSSMADGSGGFSSGLILTCPKEGTTINKINNIRILWRFIGKNFPNIIFI
jgi:hypothetical protein